ncbi:alpha/beta-hydrolase [Polychaeton citri CBS 116435]|uniref:Carboxypeptidase n=1 Tax=Polychaeton citri CBS 116435 TaxID=1314669 RepID=A0A9P4Q4W9_9PEZI|nr:alpha/beta-hydrolase [Polychaeton citri CBS 116435]
MAPTRGALAITALASTLLSTALAADKTAADYFVHHLPGAPEPLLKQYAGHIEVTPEHHGNLFFWLYENKHIADKQRTVLWLNGGPGCSSMDGAMMEVGPYRVGQSGNLTYNEGSWHEFSNLLFVDNPVGTGFSYVDMDSYIHELDTMAENMITFLEKWFSIFPEYSHDDLYIAGESYAGQHIPYIAKAILDRNARLNDPSKAWNLSGLLIGNGWISGPEQYLAYLPFAYQHGLIQGGSEAAQKVEKQQDRCTIELNERGGKDHVDVPQCEAILTEILRLSKTEEGSCFNMYDVRLTDSYPQCGMNWPPDLENVTPYLRRSDVIEALHINSDKKTGWTECSGPVSNAFHARKSAPSMDLLPGLLEQIPIILFSGDQDLICNYIGTEELIKNLRWANGTGLETTPGVSAPTHDWTFEDEPAGTYRSARNLTYIKFYNSSHMVPFDYPRRARDMLDRFTGVDVTIIGSIPTNSKIDGVDTEPSPENDDSHDADDDQLSKAAWHAYKRSGEAALVVVIILVVVWGFFLWRDRKRRRGYAGVSGDDPSDGANIGLGLNGFARKRKEQRDVEAAREFQEDELDDLSSPSGRAKERFGLHDSDAESEGESAHGPGRG